MNEGFSGANSSADLGFAYFESYLVVDYIAKQYGFEKLLELVKQYGTFKEENDMFVDVFDLSLEKFDEDFQAWIAQRVEEIGVYVHREDVPDEGEGHGHGVRSNSSAILAELYNNSSLKQHMRQRITEQANDFQAHLQLGILLFKEESYSEAKSYLHQAHELLPDYSGFPSPPLVLSQIYEKEGNREEQLQQLEILVNNQQHDYESVMILANDALDREDFSKASYYVERALGIDPYRMDVHRLNARLAELTDSLEVAVTEYQVLVELDVSDPVEAKTDLAQAYLNNGQREQARINILSALEIAPSYRRAQKVLLQAVELN